ncbi:FHA domain-containing protein, partial [Actinotalea sp. C106]|uniref:RDD family protein n=1 Tax=Actinotalea sp. C106 TaxID=2908644 RepID=UPI002029734F
AVRLPHDAALGPAFDGAVVATVGRRVGAYCLDALTVLLVAGAALLLTSHGVYAALAAAETAVALVLWEARSGRTPGHALLGLRVAQATRPYAPGLGRSLGRAVVLGAGHVLLVGQWAVLLSPMMDRSGRRQGWHDVVGGTVVVDVRALRRAAKVADQPAPPLPIPLPEPVPVVDALEAPVQPFPHTARGASAAPVQAPSTYVVTLDTGEAMSVSGPGHVGRRPSPPEGEPCEHLITIADPGRSLSRTHARFGIDGSGFWVEDCGSANGTAVLTADGTVLPLAPGERAVVPPHGAVRLGDRTFTVEPLA